VKPKLQALLVADRIYTDKNTGKKIVAGIFNSLLFATDAKIPKEIEKDGVKQKLIPGGLDPGSPYAYLSLTDIRGTQPFELRYVDLDDDQAIFRTEFQITDMDPLKTFELILPLPPLPTNKAGTFALELLCQDEPIGSYRIQVQPFKTQG
jgi:hypothetical protein